MITEVETHRRQDGEEIVICPPTTFSDLLGFSGETDSAKKLSRANVHILRAQEDRGTHYLALVDLKLRKHGLGKFLYDNSPYGRRSNIGYFEFGGQRYGIINDWEMPDQQSGSGYQRLLRIHKNAFHVEWEELEKDRRLFISGLKGNATLFPLISWEVDSIGKRTYDLETVSHQTFQVLRQRLSFGHQLQIILTQDYTRTFNPNIGLIAATHLQPALYKSWEIDEYLPLEKSEDYKGRIQVMGAAQVPLLVLWRKNQILAGRPFDAMEEYANSST